MTRQQLSFAEENVRVLDTSENLWTNYETRAFVLWILAATPAAQGLCAKIAKEICKDLRGQWMQTASLWDVSLSLNAVHAFLPEAIDGGIQAAVARRLVDAEVHVGGPYKDADQTIQAETNMLIGNYVAAVARPLPSLQPYYSAMKDWAEERLLCEEYQKDAPEVALARKIRTNDAKKYRERVDVRVKNKHIVYRAAFEELETLPPHLRSQAMTALTALYRADKSAEVGLLPLMYAQSLQHRPTAMTDALCRDLGVANIFCWLAYTIFDDLMDSEGVAATVPVASYAQRTMLAKYMNVGSFKETSRLISRVFTEMDEANSWELSHCRAQKSGKVLQLAALPDYAGFHSLYKRSLGHILGPLLLQQLTDNSRLPSLEEALRHYLIARQLNDDLHDWIDDLENGHLSAVVVRLLQNASIKPGNVVVSERLSELRKVFWQKTAAEMCDVTLDHCRIAREKLLQSSLLPHSPMMSLIQQLEDAVRKSIHMRNDGIQFIEAWSKLKREQ